jgi:hypothetical protein
MNMGERWWYSTPFAMTEASLGVTVTEMICSPRARKEHPEANARIMAEKMARKANFISKTLSNEEKRERTAS